VRRFIAAGCDIEAVDDEGASLMHILFDQRSNHSSCFDELVDLLFVEKMVKVPRKDGTLVLRLAIEARHPAHIIRKLIPDDLSIWDAKEDRRFTTLHAVVIPRASTSGTLVYRSQGTKQDDQYMIQTLEILLETQGININAKDQEGNTPLLTAASNCAAKTHDTRATIFKMLLESGADINAQNDNGDTVLHLLLLRGFNPGLLEILKFKPDVNATNNAGNTPLHVALGSDLDQSLAVRHLLKHNAKNYNESEEGKINCQIRNEKNLLAIHLGAQKDQAVAIRIMHEMGHILNIDAKTTKQETALHFATNQNNPSTAKLLVSLGADVNAADTYLVTPLHVSHLVS
jgi:ankyrin repeat protein